MFESAAVLAGAFAEHLVNDFHLVYGRRTPDHGPIIRAMAQLAVERLSSSDALYHDVQSYHDGHPGRPDDTARPHHGRGGHA